MLPLLLACGAPPGSIATDSASTTESGDTGPPADFVDLVREPTWESTESGVATGIGWVDLDADGYAELAVSYGNDIQSGPVLVYHDDGGAVEETASWSSSSTGFHGHLATGDVDGDGLPDLVVSRFLGDGGFSEPGDVELYRNLGGELETTPSWRSPERFYSFSCALGDLDRDGDLDLAVATGEPYYHDPSLSLVYTNDGTGRFDLAWSTEAPRHSLDVAWTDLDGDGWLDLVFANQGSGHTAYRNDGGSLGQEPWWTAAGEPGRFEGNTVDFGDIDGDGSMDLAISDGMQQGGAGTVSVYCGPGLERCWESADQPTDQSAVSIEDVDGDGDLDLVAGSWWGPVRVYLDRGGVLDTQPDWRSEREAVIEAFAWEDLDFSDSYGVEVSGYGLVQVPGRILSVEGGVGGDRFASGPGELLVRYLEPVRRDLAVSNWERASGNLLFTRGASR